MDEASIKKLLGDLETRLASTISASVLSGISTQLTNIDTKLSALEVTANENTKKITCNTIIANAAKTIATTAASDLKDIRTEVDILSQSTTNLHLNNTRLNSNVSRQSDFTKLLIEKNEDLTNRSLRKTIIIRGIPEGKQEKTWDDTRAVVVKALVEITDRTYDDLDSVFERIHRASKKNRQEESTSKPGPRKIHALLKDWNEIDKLSKALREGPKNNIYIDQQYGPLTTYRRNQAFMKRKSMKEAGTITGGHVKFPAYLHVRYKHGEKFVPCDDFSKIAIPDDVLSKLLDV